MREKEQYDEKKRIEIMSREKKILGRESYVKQIILLKSAQVDWEVLFDINEC